jgi:5-methylcytosine-specific restriction endonuclease McrA
MTHGVKERRAEVRRLFAMQQGLCWVCGLPMRLRPRGGRHGQFDATIDHLCPRRRGEDLGMKRPTAAAHAVCNHVRGHRPLYSGRMRYHVKIMQLRSLARFGLGLTFLDTYTNGRDYG